jgi:small-conductance mechanosensitive channel
MTVTVPRPIDDLALWAQGFMQASVLSEAALLAVAIVLAWACSAFWKRDASSSAGVRAILFGRSVFDGALFPVLLLAFGYVARAWAAHRGPLILFQVAMPVLLSLAVIRVGVKVLYAAAGDAPWARVLERSISWMAWASVVLWVSGLLPLLLTEMEQVRWQVGGSTVSLRAMLEGLLSAGAVLIGTLWLSSVIEDRLLAAAAGGRDQSLRRMATKVVRAILLFIGVLIAMSAVGIDLTALSVFSGAIGVGIGLGLQKLAANYVSGFVILAERSVRIGDLVRVDGFEGRIVDITGRYTRIRASNGSEAIVPNDTLIVSRVENLSRLDRRTAVSTTVAVAADQDVEQVRRLLLACAAARPEVLRTPAPAVTLDGLGGAVLNFTLTWHVDAARHAPATVRSEVNLALWRALREHGIRQA